MKASEIREKFIRFFESKNHVALPSSPLVPQNDPTLLFTNAGMNQFKDQFTGKSHPLNKRVVTVQKCVRAGGKHNDLENVGFTARHHTFFEMLGNFSFGDYFKKDAIAFAWEFLTQQLKIPKDKLYITVFRTDQEAADIWHREQGVPKERIFFRDEKDNFWEMGDVGPCGPCSEIFYDHGEKFADQNLKNPKSLLDDEMRYVEIWNLVFMQYEKYREGQEIKMRELPQPSVDTGAGLERVVAAMQGVYQNYDTDLFTGIIASIEKISKKKYIEFPQSMRVVADHARSSTMLLADGVLPSNEGRGYVLRRIIRRAVRFLDLLGVEKVCFDELVEPVLKSFVGVYPEIQQNADFIKKFLRIEEESFRKTLSSGLKLLHKEIELLKSAQSPKLLSGEIVFKLYDTHGFPADLTEIILNEQGLGYNQAEFETAMHVQKERSKKANDFSAATDNAAVFYKVKEQNGGTQFLGYQQLSTTTKLVAKIPLENNKQALIFDQTPFYPEGGGQAGDQGYIQEPGSSIRIAAVLDTKKPVEGLIVHITDSEYDFKEGAEYQLFVDAERRRLTMSHHTATHLLQAALIKILGSHIKQAGSSVGPDRLRFDFTHPEALTKKQLQLIETLINEQIQKRIEVLPEEMEKDKALAKGAMALFGEKYDQRVRVIEVPGFSIELCGGTHVQNTSDIVYFKILSEGSLAAGVRRIEAITNSKALFYVEERMHLIEELETELKAKGSAILDKIRALSEQLAQSQKQAKTLQDQLRSQNAKQLFENVLTLKNGSIFKYIETNDDLREVSQLFVDKFPRGVVLLASQDDSRASVVLRAGKDVGGFDCAKTLQPALASRGGKGGGRPDVAQGTLPSEKLNDLVSAIHTQIGV